MSGIGSLPQGATAVRDDARAGEARLRAALERALRAAPVEGAAEDAAARLDEEAAVRLLDHLAPVRIEPRRVIELAARSRLQPHLEERFPRARIVTCAPLATAPAATSMRARRLFRRPRPRSSPLASSLLRLPLLPDVAELVVSNLALFWYPDPAPVLAEAWRVLRPGGLLAFGTLGAATLLELRESWAAVDGYAHLVDFIDMHDLGDAMQRAGFRDVVMDAERITVTWRDVPALLADVRALGTGNPHAGRAPGLMAPSRLARLARAHEAAHRTPEGTVRATVELVYGHGWKGQDAARVPAPATAEVPLADLTRARHGKSDKPGA